MLGMAVLRSFMTDDYWRNFETFTLLHPYKTLQGQISKTFVPLGDMVKRYSEISGHLVDVVTAEYSEEHPEVASQNVALLKNAIELWKVASQTSDMVAPVLYHYSVHCFISFFNYTFFKWTPEHVTSHGMFISKWSDELIDIEIEVTESNKTVFRRFVDTGVLLGACLAFSPFLPTIEKEEITFVPNDDFLFKESKRISLKQLLAFDAKVFDETVNMKLTGKRFLTHFIDLTYSPSNFFRDYIVVFVGSSLARYRPYLWTDVLESGTAERADFALALTRALINIPRYFSASVSRVFQAIRKSEFGPRKR
jgi:hypothetical protein